MMSSRYVVSIHDPFFAGPNPIVPYDDLEIQSEVTLDEQWESFKEGLLSNKWLFSRCFL